MIVGWVASICVQAHTKVWLAELIDESRICKCFLLFSVPGLNMLATGKIGLQCKVTEIKETVITVNGERIRAEPSCFLSRR